MSYPYQKHIWVTKEVIRREYLQNISDGIYDEQQDRLLKEGLLNDDIVAESNRAKQAEQNITNNLNAEILRAEEAEAAIARDLSSEISRSTTAEGELTDDVADLDARLLDESTRALDAENEISTALANEIARATNVENDLRSITTRAYKASGSVYFADLPALDVSRQGNVYDVKDAFTTTSDFQEGAGKDYPAGTNVAIVSVEGDYYTEVTPIGTENPSQEGWYVLDDNEYVLTTDTEVESGTTYYSYSDYKMMYDANSGFIDTSHFVTDTDYATSQAAGIMKPDGVTCSVDAQGVLTAVGGGSGSAEAAEMMIAPIEADATASARAYSVGQRLILNEILYKAKTAIAIGDALVVDTNIESANAITDFDTTPTQGSTKFVTSGGVYSYIDTMITQALAASY